MSDDLIRHDALTVVDRLKRGEVTPHDLLDALEKRIAAVDGAVNALPTLCFDRARAHADRLMKKPVAERGALAGMPIPIKDLVDVDGRAVDAGLADLRQATSRRSPTFWSSISKPKAASSTRCRTRRSSARAPIPSTRFSARRSIRGTRRARPRAHRAARRSRSRPAWRGSRMAPTWAARCAIRRASTASSASARASGAWRTTPKGSIDMNLSQQGPMARNVEDVAFLLDAMSGEDPRDPFSLPRTGESYLAAARSNWRPKRVAWSRRSRRHEDRQRGRGDHPQGGGAVRRTRRDGRGGASGFLRAA